MIHVAYLSMKKEAYIIYKQITDLNAVKKNKLSDLILCFLFLVLFQYLMIYIFFVYFCRRERVPASDGEVGRLNVGGGAQV